MDNADWYAIIGHVASALVVTSLLMESLRRLRMISLAGSIFFATYGFLIESTPILLVNSAIFLINVRWLWRMSRERDYFSLLETDLSSNYLARFLSFHAEEIAKYQPEFTPPEEPAEVFFILRNMVPVGLWIGHETGDSRLQVDLDFVIPRYRDARAGVFFYGEDGPVSHRALITPPPAPGHAPYLEKMGFKANQDGWYVRPPQIQPV
jgi:hypothetical protein